MSEDRVSFYFESERPADPIEQVASRIAAHFELGGRKVRELEYEKKHKTC